jgi:hypothetical protein
VALFPNGDYRNLVKRPRLSCRVVSAQPGRRHHVSDSISTNGSTQLHIHEQQKRSLKRAVGSPAICVSTLRVTDFLVVARAALLVLEAMAKTVAAKLSSVMALH